MRCTYHMPHNMHNRSYIVYNASTIASRTAANPTTQSVAWTLHMSYAVHRTQCITPADLAPIKETLTYSYAESCHCHVHLHDNHNDHHCCRCYTYPASLTPPTEVASAGVGLAEPGFLHHVTNCSAASLNDCSGMACTQFLEMLVNNT